MSKISVIKARAQEIVLIVALVSKLANWTKENKLKIE